MLLPDERLVWSGRPDTSRWVVPGGGPQSTLCFAAGLFATALSLLILATTVRDGVSAIDLLFVLMGSAFAALGLYLLVGRVVARRFIGRRTTYGLTDLRGLVVRPRRTSIVWLRDAPAVSERIRPDGHGTVMIGASIYQRAAWFAGDPGWYFARPWERSEVAFWNIPDAAEVARLATELINSSTS